MNAIEFTKGKERMCTNFTSCKRCPMYVRGLDKGMSCPEFISKCPEESADIVKNWTETHPPITNAMKFREVFGFDHRTSAPWWDQEYRKPMVGSRIQETEKGGSGWTL